MVTVADTLEMAADKLAAPGAWTQGSWARDKAGRKVEPSDPTAVCWCLDGALLALEPDGDTLGYLELIGETIGRKHAVINWNDEETRTQAEVVAALRAAAAKARES